MSFMVQAPGVTNFSLFQQVSSDVIFTVEQCHAINNIEFVLQSIRPFVDDLNVHDILTRIEELNGGLVADACRKTIKALIENAVESVENQIICVSSQQVPNKFPTSSQHVPNKFPTSSLSKDTFSVTVAVAGVIA
jgi:hypothetical protein